MDEHVLHKVSIQDTWAYNPSKRSHIHVHKVSIQDTLHTISKLKQM